MYGSVTNFISFLKPESEGCTNFGKLCFLKKSSKLFKRSWESILYALIELLDIDQSTYMKILVTINCLVQELLYHLGNDHP